MIRSTGETWRCPPAGRGQAPWCRGLPCPGHRATHEQTKVAKALALADAMREDPDRPGLSPQEWHDPRNRAERAAYLERARLALHQTGPGLGRPR